MRGDKGSLSQKRKPGRSGVCWEGKKRSKERERYFPGCIDLENFPIKQQTAISSNNNAEHFLHIVVHGLLLPPRGSGFSSLVPPPPRPWG